MPTSRRRASPHRALLVGLMLILLACAVSAATAPSTSCQLIYGGIAGKDRSSSTTKVGNNSYILQPFPIQPSLSMLYLPSGYTYYLRSILLAVDPSQPFDNATSVKIAIYQSPDNAINAAGVALTTRNGVFPNQTRDFIPLSSSGLSFGDVELTAGKLLWFGLEFVSGSFPLTVTLSSIPSPSETVAARCIGATFPPSINTPADFDANGCSEANYYTTQTAAIWIQVRLYVDPCPCSLPAPEGITNCIGFTQPPKWQLSSNNVTNLTIPDGSSGVFSEDPITIDGTLTISGQSDGGAAVGSTNCTYIDPGSTLVVATSGSSDSRNILVIDGNCVVGTFSNVTVQSSGQGCNYTAEQYTTVEGFFVYLTPIDCHRSSLAKWVIPVVVVSLIAAALLVGAVLYFLFQRWGPSKNCLFSSSSEAAETYVQMGNMS